MLSISRRMGARRARNASSEHDDPPTGCSAMGIYGTKRYTGRERGLVLELFHHKRQEKEDESARWELWIPR